MRRLGLYSPRAGVGSLSLGGKPPSGSVITTPINLILLGDSITAQNILSTKYPVGYITGATKANPGVITSTGHPFTTGNNVFNWGVQGMVELNETFTPITLINANSYSIQNTSSYSTYTTGGKSFSYDGTSHGKSMAGYFTRANQILKQRLYQTLRWNRGISSETTTAFVQRLNQSLPTGKGINAVCVLGGTNDVNSSVPLSTYQANIDAIVNRVTVDMGAYLILLTPTPVNGNSGAQKDLKDSYVNYIKSKHNGANIFVVDTYAAVTELSTRSWKAGYSGDGTHPNALGAEYMAFAIADTLATYFGRGSSLINDGNLTNPFLTGTGGTPTGLVNSGFATSWDTTIFGAMTNKGTCYKDVNDVQHVAINFAGGEATNSGFTVVQYKNTGFSVGEWYEASVEYKLNSWSGTGLLLEISGGTTTTGTSRSFVDAGVISGSPVQALAPSELVSRSASGSLIAKSHPFVIESGMTSIRPRLQMRFNPSVGPITADISILAFQLNRLPSNPYL